MESRKLIGAILLALGLQTIDASAGDQGAGSFAQCLSRLGDSALEAGVSASTVALAVAGIEAPLSRVVDLDRQQPEFLQTFAEYVSARVSTPRVVAGKALGVRYGAFLESLLRQYGVPPRYLLAFWGLETNYGSYLGKIPTLPALATLACDRRRSEFFTTEWVNALKLMERESLTPEQLVGSWAGAVGHTQFMPSSYLRHAIDGDGDGRVDLWGSERDALASGANFLRSLGWQPGQRWGRQVELPAGFAYELSGLQVQKPLVDWERLGVRLPGGGVLPASDIEASLLLPAGHRGPAFLVYENFRVAMRWNQSQSYALAVGLLADRLAGAPPLDYDAMDIPKLRKSTLLVAQQQLNTLGFDAGKPDGVLGRQTRAALRAFQLAHALPADGYPGEETLAALAAKSAAVAS